MVKLRSKKKKQLSSRWKMKDQHKMYEISTQIFKTAKKCPLHLKEKEHTPLCHAKWKRFSLLPQCSFPWICPLSPAPSSSIPGHLQLSEEKFLSSKGSVAWALRNFIKDFLVDSFPWIQERDTYPHTLTPDSHKGRWDESFSLWIQ